MSDKSAETLSIAIVILGFFIMIGGIFSKPPKTQFHQIKYAAQDIKQGFIGAACINAGHKWKYENCEYTQ